MKLELRKYKIVLHVLSFLVIYQKEYNQHRFFLNNTFHITETTS